MLAIARSNVAEYNWGRAFAYAAFFVIALMALVEPAFAQGAFGDLQSTVVDRTNEAFETGRTILYAAAALALIIGIAPMLWGQVKVKWIVSCLVAAVLFAIVPTIITAFAG
ncbi:hypothetical protein [uncultured Salinicola sp.]|uniref:hypothetical protein n=1 Tax=uncultured Salinicola sp. TaxID=1193542 RepID=UPI00262176C4|nr:hypothetical protein [uncultured Salinicola sp.]|tara:strand:+ start:4723 stop:5055 length:333 start_codon:yes stop_codon:yes gene_type:complete